MEGSEESRDSESIAKSDEDWAAQDQQDYERDGFIVSDDEVSYSSR